MIAEGTAKELLQAIADSNREAVSALLSSGRCKINDCVNWQSRTISPLALAAEKPALDILQELILARADINQAVSIDNWCGTSKTQMYSGYSALFFAVASSDEQLRSDAVRLLAKAQANVNWTGPNGMTPLMKAVEKNAVDLIRPLAEARAQLDHRNIDGDSALFIAARSLGRTTIPALIDAGADLNSQSSSGCTAIMVAAKADNLARARELLDARADLHFLDTGGQSALAHAALRGRSRVVASLLEARASCTPEDLCRAVEGRSLDSVMLLSQARADPTALLRNGSFDSLAAVAWSVSRASDDHKPGDKEAAYFLLERMSFAVQDWTDPILKIQENGWLALEETASLFSAELVTLLYSWVRTFLVVNRLKERQPSRTQLRSAVQGDGVEFVLVGADTSTLTRCVWSGLAHGMDGKRLVVSWHAAHGPSIYEDFLGECFFVVDDSDLNTPDASVANLLLDFEANRESRKEVSSVLQRVLESSEARDMMLVYPARLVPHMVFRVLVELALSAWPGSKIVAASLGYRGFGEHGFPKCQNAAAVQAALLLGGGDDSFDELSLGPGWPSLLALRRSCSSCSSGGQPGSNRKASFLGREGPLTTAFCERWSRLALPAPSWLESARDVHCGRVTLLRALVSALDGADAGALAHCTADFLGRSCECYGAGSLPLPGARVVAFDSSLQLCAGTVLSNSRQACFVRFDVGFGSAGVDGGSGSALSHCWLGASCFGETWLTEAAYGDSPWRNLASAMQRAACYRHRYCQLCDLLLVADSVYMIEGFFSDERDNGTTKVSIADCIEAMTFIKLRALWQEDQESSTDGAGLAALLDLAEIYVGIRSVDELYCDRHDEGEALSAAWAHVPAAWPMKRRGASNDQHRPELFLDAMAADALRHELLSHLWSVQLSAVQGPITPKRPRCWSSDSNVMPDMPPPMPELLRRFTSIGSYSDVESMGLSGVCCTSSDAVSRLVDIMEEQGLALPSEAVLRDELSKRHYDVHDTLAYFSVST